MADRVALGMAALTLGLQAKAERFIDRSAVRDALALCNGFALEDPVAEAVRGFGAVFPSVAGDREALKAQGTLLVHVVEENFGASLPAPRADLDG